jgi:hypothetical protein
MLRSTLGRHVSGMGTRLGVGACAAFVAAACTTNSDNAHVVTAPVASVGRANDGMVPPTGSAASGPVAPSASAAQAASASPGAGDGAQAPGGAPDADGGVAAFQACQSDSDCIAVPRNGCCHNGWKEAVNVAQQDAYRNSFTCPQAHPICPMYIVRDARIARCDVGAHLCKMVQP